MVKLALLWHMHQPYYEDLATGEHILPWVRLHAIKDYWGMVAMLEEFPGVRVTFNLVPSLVRQVQAFAEDRAQDRHLELGLKPAAELTPDEARWMVANGFHAPYARMIGPYPRYARAARVPDGPAARSPKTTCAICRSGTSSRGWIPTCWRAIARLVALVDKGRGFTEDDKALLCAASSSSCWRAWSPPIGRRARAGRSSSPTSPFYHPILPLLCDSDAHQVAHPGAPQPRTRFTRPGDARLQIDARDRVSRSDVRQPAVGMWPSEGSVSDEAVALMADAGLKWIATDEDILARSLNVAIADAAGAAVPAVSRRRARAGRVVPRSRDVRSHRVSLPVVGRRAAAADFVEHVRDGGPAVRRGRRRGSRDRHRSSSTARTPGSTTTAAAGRSCARSTARCRTRRRHRDGHDGRGGGGSGDAAAVDLPRVVDQRRLLHLDRPSRRPPRVGPAVGGARRVRRSARTRSRPRRATGRSRSS